MFAAVDGDPARPRRPGLICSRLRRTTKQGARRHGLPVDSAEEILLRCARDLGHIDLVILVVSALRAGDVDETAMAAGPRVPETRRLRPEGGMGRGAEGAPVTGRGHPVPVPSRHRRPRRSAGHPVRRPRCGPGQADLHVIGTKYVHEYDGAVHRDKVQHRTDLRRERGWAGSDYVRRGYTLDDLLNHSMTVMHEIDRALGRPHELTAARALVRHGGELAVLRRGPRAGDEPVASGHGGHRLVTNTVRLRRFPAVGDQTATPSPREPAATPPRTA